jgi:nitrite reductase/ring-hydroxylating ferredoxin subunit
VSEIDLARVICRMRDLDGGRCHEFRLPGGGEHADAFVLRTGSEVRAFVNRCAHLSLRLNLLPGRFLTHDGSMILCTAHGAIFEKATGYCVAGPCVGRALTPVAIEVVGDCVQLAPGTGSDAGSVGGS